MAVRFNPSLLAEKLYWAVERRTNAAGAAEGYRLYMGHYLPSGVIELGGTTSPGTGPAVS